MNVKKLTSKLKAWAAAPEQKETTGTSLFHGG
jgi:hypothetical protein